jgi:NNP family nitrate/nitrite transporter-like MFS transporter
VIRESLYLTGKDVGNAGIAAVVGAVASRVAMGNMVDMYGPRFGYSFLLLLTAPAIYCMSMVTSEWLCVLGPDAAVLCWFAAAEKAPS